MQRAQADRRSPARIAALVTGLAGIPGLPVAVPAQQLSFAVPIITWDSAALVSQQQAYGLAAMHREQVFCLDAWRRVAADRGVILYVVLHARRAAVGQAHGINDIGSLCRAANGVALPMLHTHSDGNCQFSPADLVTSAARGAPFDGVQCGPRYFIWESAWQVNAIANELEREHAKSIARAHP